MNDRIHDDKNAKVRAIVDDAIAELLMVGMESSSAAASLMAIQAMLRIDDRSTMESVAKFALSLLDDGDD